MKSFRGNKKKFNEKSLKMKQTRIERLFFQTPFVSDDANAKKGKVKTMKDVSGKNLPEIIEVTLLSSEELVECADYINDGTDDLGPSPYYLRTAYEDNQIGTATGNCEDEEPCDPDYEDTPPYGPWGFMLRPILRLASANLKDGTVLEAGDNVVIGKNTFTAISGTILFSDRAAWIEYDGFTASYGYFDDETNVYEDSLAKKRVDEWFEKKIKPNL